MDSHMDTRTIHEMYWSNSRKYRFDLFMFAKGQQLGSKTGILLDSQWYEWEPQKKSRGDLYDVNFNEGAIEPYQFDLMITDAKRDGRFISEEYIDSRKCTRRRLTERDTDSAKIITDIWIDSDEKIRKIDQTIGMDDIFLYKLVYPIIYDVAFPDTLFEIPSDITFTKSNKRRIRRES